MDPETAKLLADLEYEDPAEKRGRERLVALLRGVVRELAHPRVEFTLLHAIAVDGDRAVIIAHGMLLLLGPVEITKPKYEGFIFVNPILGFVEPTSADASLRVRKHVIARLAERKTK